MRAAPRGTGYEIYGSKSLDNLICFPAGAVLHSNLVPSAEIAHDDSAGIALGKICNNNTQ